MTKTLTISQFVNIKTKKCSNAECPIGQMFSTEVRARYYQLIFASDKCCFSCDGYHTEQDTKRKLFEVDEGTKKTKNVNEYRSEYLVEFSLASNKKQTKKQSNSKEFFSNTCQNLVQYLYHPMNYKKIDCPFINSLSKDLLTQTNDWCKYAYCPFSHNNETLDPELQKFLNNYRAKVNKVTTHGLSQSDPLEDKKKFQQKLLNIMLLRSCRSIDDLFNRQSSVFATHNQSASISSNTNITDSPISHFPVEDRAQIQKIKQKLVSKANLCLKIDKQREKEEQSRKVMDKNFSKSKENKNTPTTKTLQQMESDVLGVSYNYFKYGQKISLIQGRTIQFKHFKDISDPNHIPLIMKYIAAFLNTEGGKLYIGVDDNSYVYGAKFKQTQYDKLLLKIDNEGKFYMNPPLMPQKYNIKLIPVYHDRKDQQRWVIQIMVFPPKQQNKKLFLYNRECYMRMNASTHKLNASDIIELISLNNENQAIKQQQLSPIDEIQQIHQSKTIHDQTQQIDQTKQISPSQRQNQLMSQTSKNPKARSSSKPKFQTEESKLKQFQQKLSTRSIEDLYLLRKDYEQKLNTIMAVYKKKQRETR